MNPANETDLGREVRKEVADILAKYSGPHEAIAGVKVSTLRKIDQLINPEPETYEIRPTPAPYLAMEQARVDRLLFEVAQ